MENIQSLLQGLALSFRKRSEPSPQSATTNMPPSPESTTVDSVEKLIQPIAAITDIVKARTPKHEPSYLAESSACIKNHAMKRESPPNVSPAKKRQKTSDDHLPDIDPADISNILFDTIGKYIQVLLLNTLLL